MANLTLADVTAEEITEMRNTPISEHVEETLGLTEADFMEVVTESVDGAAPVTDVPPALAFAAGLLVGKRYAEWGDV